MSLSFSTFWTALKAIEDSLAITTPVSLSVKRSYWGVPAYAVTDLPCIFNEMVDDNRVLGMASTRFQQNLKINIQLLAAKSTREDERSSLIATQFWFAAKQAFDANPKITNTVIHSVLQGGVPTVPVILVHAGESYIGFSSVLEIIMHEAIS